MYEEFYGLNRRPFENTPNPEFFFASKQHREALAALIYGIKQSKGFMLVTGEVGSGKTFLIQSLKYELEEENHIILEVATPWITPEELFAELPQKLGMDMDPEWGSLVFQAKLKEQLEQLHEQGRRVLVILDEAQQLPERTLEGIRLLSNFENEDAKLIQIIFLGQNELNDILGRYSMRQIRQRITLSRSLGYFNETETRRYIEHRLSVSGCTESVFNDDALSLIFKKSHGSPRLVNLICDNCLITGYAHFARTIDVHVVREVLSDLPSVHSGAYDYDQAPPPSEEEQPLRVVAEAAPRVDAKEPVGNAQAEPTPVYEADSRIEPRNKDQSKATPVTESAFAVPEPLPDYDEGEIKPRERKSSGVLSRYGLWLVLIATVVVSWYAARWYETSQKEAVVETEPPVTTPSVEPMPVTAVQPASEPQKQLTWDDDPVMSGVAEIPAESVEVESSLSSITPEPPRQQPLPSAVTATADTASERETTQQPYKSALERYSAGTTSNDGLSLFERLRQEANVADVRAKPIERQAMDVKVEPSVIPETAKPVVVEQQKAPVVTNLAKMPKPVVPVRMEGRAQVGVLEGVVVSSRRVKRYESGESIPYPFEQSALTKSLVRFTDGATVSQLARAKYSTWNDTVQDMVRALNPKLKSLDRVYTKNINLPDISREDLIINDEARGWFVYAGTVTSRLKANNLYESFVALGEPADMEITRNAERRIYRVYMGPYDNRDQAVTQFNSVDLTHMPYLR
ncbi:AAA family ATPase [Pontibacterium sp.]|uniref:AAA family ATPase n=1 Tax=Pontibacterium sp. TaxID=2036026 RepID=UPI0035637654